MSVETWLRLALVPAAVWLASLAARRWGHTASGYLGGLPLIGGPITLYLALDHGAQFAAHSAVVTLAAIAGQAAHLTVFTHVGRRARWPVALAAGWASFAVLALGVAMLPFTPAMGLALAAVSLVAAFKAIPHPRGEASLPAVPPIELRLRLAAALGIAIVILWSAQEFGAVVSGVLLSVPVTGSIMPPFTLALYGPGAVARLARGFVVGLSGFSAFFFVVGSCVVSLGITMTFVLAFGAALATVVALVTAAMANNAGRVLSIIAMGGLAVLLLVQLAKSEAGPVALLFLVGPPALSAIGLLSPASNATYRERDRLRATGR